MIIVTGANGPFGRLVVEHLVSLVPASEVVASVREPDAFTLSVQVRRGDFNDPATLDFSGADTVFLNATNYGSPPEMRGAQQANAIAAARDAGVRRIVLTSWQDADRCPLPSMVDYPATERLVAGSVPAWTVLRVGYGLAAALARDVITARKAGVLSAPAGQARVAAAATADLAEAAARVVASGDHDGVTYDLTGPDAAGWAELAELAGPGIAYRPAGDDEFSAQMAAGGFPAAAMDQLLALYAAFRGGWANTPTGDLARLLGRPPTPTLDAVAQAVDGWRWS
jgi:NAD(P)H dehydrogenase (quinone)